jgi:hypothetical protein
MPSKKTPTPKKPRGKKPVGLTSAIGPKATTVLVICVMAGGIAAASWQKDQAAKAKARDEAMMMAADTVVADTVAPVKKGAKARPAALTTTSAPEPSATPALTTMSSVAKKPDTTLTGCLERTDDGFRLKDTEGENAPKSRSWKSGFLKKGSASISVTDPSRTLRLASQVGHRVTVTGALANRELRAAALHQIAPTCK